MFKDKIAINGLGRIGRAVLKIGLSKGLKIEAINDLVDTENLAYLLKYDSVYGRYNKEVEAGDDYLKIGNRKIKVFHEKDPSKLPWKDLEIDKVVESTGLFTDKKSSMRHVEAGAKKVLVSAPCDYADSTVVLGVNDKKIGNKDQVISNASCTTNCLAPVAKVLNEKFGIENGFMTTVHAYTGNQGLVDSPSKKLRRGRAAAENIVPTSTGASKAVEQVLPELKGKLDGKAIRVPVPTGSIIDFVVQLKEKTNKEEVNKEFEKASKKMKSILGYTKEPIVSRDIVGSPYSAILDSEATQVKGNMVKVLAWYDNEWGYSTRMVDVLKII